MNQLNNKLVDKRVMHVTTKMQVYIPSDWVKEFNLNQGDLVILQKSRGGIFINIVEGKKKMQDEKITRFIWGRLIGDVPK